MKTHNWVDMKNRMSPARRERVQKRVDAEIQAINLRRLREELGATQVAAAEQASMTQPELSRLERATDVRFSTIRRYVQALGGDLEVVAVVKGKRIPLVG